MRPLVPAALLAVAAPATAGGFLIQEQSATGLGRAFAGDGAQADSALDQWSNPALLADLATPQVAGSLTGLFLRADAANTGTTRAGPIGASPVAGAPGGNPFHPINPVPAAAVSVPLGFATAGLSVNAPFGLIVSYPRDWFGRYDSTYSRLRTYNIAGSLARRFGPLAVGAGLDAQRIEARLDSALPNPLNPAVDGSQSINGADWSLGWHAGVTLDASPALRLAVSYRSGVRHTLNGTFTIAGLSAPLAAANSVAPATAPVRLPDQLGFAARFTPAANTRILASAIRTGWNSFDAIRVTTADGRTFASPQNYRSTWRYALGLEHDLSPAITLRAGAQRDNTPTTDAERTTRVPDGDRTWLALGATWAATPRLALSAAYAHVFVSREPVNRTDTFFAGTPLATSVATRASGTGNADLLGLQAAFRF